MEFSKLKYGLLLIIATGFWGFGFIGTKWTLVDYGPYWSNALRYLFASILVVPYFFKTKIFKRPLIYFKAPLVASFILFVSFHFQTLGLKYTTAGKSGFVTALYALFAPIFALFLFKKRYQRSFWGLVALSLIGVFFLCHPIGSRLNIGDFYTLIGAIFFGLHIVYLGIVAKSYSAKDLNFLQCFFMFFFAAPLAFFVEGDVSLFPLLVEPLSFGSSFLGFLSISFFSSLIAFTIQAYCQKFLSSHVVGLIMLLEAFFAAVFGYWVFGETLTIINLMGGVLLILSVALVPSFTKFSRN